MSPFLPLDRRPQAASVAVQRTVERVAMLTGRWGGGWQSWFAAAAGQKICLGETRKMAAWPPNGKWSHRRCRQSWGPIWMLGIMLLGAGGCGVGDTPGDATWSADGGPPAEAPAPSAAASATARNPAHGSNPSPAGTPRPATRELLPDSAVAGFEQRSKSSAQPSGDRDDRNAMPAAVASATPVPAPLPTEAGQDDYLPRRRLGPLALVDVQPESLARAGLHRSSSPHLTLITDHPDLASFAEFHDVLAQAIEQWTDFFQADPRRFQTWRLTCFLVVDEAKFASAGLLPGPGHLPEGKLPPGGWQFGNQIWVRHQPGPYYTRHMLLHEGTHGFCAYNFGALGPPWLAEGLAEYLAVHRWHAGRLQLAARVADKDELPYWGRVKLIQEAYQTGAPKSLLEVLRFPPQAFPQTEAYAWSWAAVSLWAGHPDLSPVFREQLKKLGTVTDGQWTRDLLQGVKLTRDQLETQWQVDTRSLRYGHDFGRTAIRWKQAERLSAADARVVIPADGAWHSSGWILPPGRWQVTAAGTYTVAEDETGPWVAQPDGITISYVQGAPLGQLQYALQGERAILAGMSELTRPEALGSAEILTASGEELFLRINDFPSQLDDNRGEVEVLLRRL